MVKRNADSQLDLWTAGPTKKCSRCGEEKAWDQYTLEKKTGRPHAYCKRCMADRHLERLYADDPEGLAAAFEKRRLRESAPEGMRWCSKCNEVKPESEFYPRRGRVAKGRQFMSQCKQCSGKRYRTQAEASAARTRQRKYGLSDEEFEALLNFQNGLCAICGKQCRTGRTLAIDHDHACCPGQKSCGKCVRGLLCGDCNNGLGRFNDDPALLRAAADYLERQRTLNP